MRAAAAACIALLLLLCALGVVGLARLSSLTENLDEARVRQRVVQDQVDKVAAQVAPSPGSWRDQVAGSLKDLGTGLLDVTVRVDKVDRALKEGQAQVDELRKLLESLAHRPRMPDDGR